MSTESIWKEFSKRLENFILSKVNDPDLANDLLQDVFVKIHINKDKLESNEKLKSWLYTITRNVIMDYYRKKRIESDDILESLEYPSQEELNQENIVFQKCLEPYILALPDKYKEALVKTTFENLSQKDLATLNNISYSAAKSRVQRAREMVKNQIIACCNPTSDVYGNIIEKEPCKNACGCEE